MSSVMNHPSHADMELRCRGSTYMVHRLVLCTASNLFGLAYEEATKNGKPCVVEITLFDASVVEHMLQFLYQGEYNVASPDPMPHKSNAAFASMKGDSKATTHPAHTSHQHLTPNSPNPHHVYGKKAAVGALVRYGTNPLLQAAKMHIKVFCIAEQFNIEGLQELALINLKAELNTLNEPSPLLEVARAVYSLKQEGYADLRTVLLSRTMRHLVTVCQSRALMCPLATDPNLQAFTADLLSNFVESAALKNAALWEELARVRAEMQRLVGYYP